MTLVERFGRAARELLSSKELMDIPKDRDITVRSRASKIETGDQSLLSKRTRDTKRLGKYETIYKNDGIVSQLIDCIALHVVESGWNLRSEDPGAREMVKEFLESVDFDNLLIHVVRDALVFGDAFIEKVYTRGNQLVGLVPISPKTMEIVHDPIGRPRYYTQTVDVDGQPRKKNIAPEFIMHIVLRQLGREIYGESLIGANYDTIIRKAKADEGIANFIERHGFRKYHIKINKPAEQVTEAALKKTQKTFEKINSKNEFITTEETDIRDIDQGGTDIREVHEYFMDQLCAGFGVPEEIAGLGRGSTEATAKVRMVAFERSIMGFQTVLSSTIERQCFSEILKHHSIREKVKLVFMSISPDDEKDKSVWIANVLKVMPDALTKDEVRELFGFEPVSDADDEEAPEEKPPPAKEPTPEELEAWKREKEMAEKMGY